MRNFGRSHNRALAAFIALLLVLAIVGLARHPPPTSTANAVPVFGVLQADPKWLSADSAAGLRLAMINVFWRSLEPSPDHFDEDYAESIRKAVGQYRHAGWQVAIDVGLQSPPSWVLNLPSGRLRDQNGHESRGADFEFSEAVRQAAAGYISTVVKTLGPVQYYRVGLSEQGEAKYPDVVGDGWWAFEPTAQGTAPGLPPGVRTNPLPGWVPGSPRYRGHSLETSQVANWYSWYFDAVVNAHTWEIAAYRSAGYKGDLQLVMPGYGATPAMYQFRIAHDLAPPGALDSYRTLNSGSVWWRLLDALPDMKGIVVDISSVDDRSGDPRGNDCEPTDTTVDYLTSTAPWRWSDTRWLTYLARLHHLQVMGENPGDTPASDLPRIMSLVRSCGLIALQWAFEPELHAGSASVTTIDQLGAAITRFDSRSHS